MIGLVVGAIHTKPLRHDARSEPWGRIVEYDEVDVRKPKLSGKPGYEPHSLLEALTLGWMRVSVQKNSDVNIAFAMRARFGIPAKEIRGAHRGWLGSAQHSGQSFGQGG